MQCTRVPPVWGEDDYMRPEFEDDPLLQFGKQAQHYFVFLHHISATGVIVLMSCVCPSVFLSHSPGHF